MTETVSQSDSDTQSAADVIEAPEGTGISRSEQDVIEAELPLEPSNEGRPSLPEDLCVPARNWPKARK